MKLEDTVKLMTSTDYKDRFLAEYHQVKIRAEKLTETLKKDSQGLLNFALTSRSLLEAQLKSMLEYQIVLEKRAKTEGIDVNQTLDDSKKI